MSPRIALLLSLLGISLAAPAAAQSPFAPKVTGPLSQRVVAYQIDANYDPPKHTVDASETLTYQESDRSAAGHVSLSPLSECVSAEVDLDARGASRRQLSLQQPERMEAFRLRLQ